MKTYYVGMDVHKATIVIAVLDVNGKVVSQSIIKTTTQTVRDFLHSMRGEIHVTIEEGNHAAWLYDVIKPLVKALVVCNPKHNHLLKQGSKNKSLDRSGGSVLRIKTGAAKVALIRAARSTQTLDLFVRQIQ